MVTTFFKKCKNLANRILDVIGIGLDLKVTNLSSVIVDKYSMLTVKRFYINVKLILYKCKNDLNIGVSEILHLDGM